MKHNIRSFKVGDKVTPDRSTMPDHFKDSEIYKEAGRVFIVVETVGNTIELNNNVGSAGTKHWDIQYWKYAKNVNILNIINNL